MEQNKGVVAINYLRWARAHLHGATTISALEGMNWYSQSVTKENLQKYFENEDLGRFNFSPKIRLDEFITWYLLEAGDLIFREIALKELGIMQNIKEEKKDEG